MITRSTFVLTPDELREKNGLEIYDDISELTGEHPERTIVKNEFDAEILGVDRGQVVAMPPVNPRLIDTEIIGGEGLERRKWIRRVEGAHWQADLFIEAEGSTWGEPLYDMFDRLGEVVPQMKMAVETTPPWREIHDTMRKTKDRVLGNPGSEPPHGLHQRYG